MSNDKKLDFLQALRGLAIMMVVLSHARWFFLVTPYQQTAETLLHAGAAGVDIFFVISGFIMAYTTKGNDGSPASLMRFYVRRFTKIWIPYAVIGIATFAVEKGAGMFTHENLVWTVKSLVFIPPDVHSLLYLGGGLTNVAWSLNYEAYFYLIFGLSMLFARFRYVALFAWCGIFLIAVPLWDHGHASLLVTARVDSNSAYFQLMTNPIIFEFLGGVIIGKIYCSSFTIREPLTARLLAFSGCIAFVWCILENLASDNGLLGWGGWAMGMVLALSVASKSIRIPFPATLAWIGNISYALYLVHPLVNMVVNQLFLHYGLAPLIPTVGHVVLTTSISIVVAAFANATLDERLHVKVRDHLLASRLLRTTRIPTAAQTAP